ncbi:Serine/threonine-protein kinase PrkC [Novipirellula galeiformis]|uniref:Serine/threonine-protein kinase PrkC n=1 Tax=Novipirellula galeiformis TaxID=2528004 RepID=A0A5C6CIZ3_9BACT|nr:Serine/threonine-protein kinase PrkC [Novipirellula galeiformis]
MDREGRARKSSLPAGTFKGFESRCSQTSVSINRSVKRYLFVPTPSSSNPNPLADEQPTCAGDGAGSSGSGDALIDFSASVLQGDGSAVSALEVASVSQDLPERLGDYAVKSMLGSGGMGQVYLAEHVRMQRTVALKMLPVQLMQDQRAVERFYEEIRAASRVLHPNIVAAFDAGEDHGIHYLAMEYVDGMTLTNMVATRGPLAVGEAASIIRQAAMGLLHAHRAGIIHRDVKPGNIMRSHDGTVKVLDLGLARISTAGLRTRRHATSEARGSNSEADGTNAARPSKGRLVGTLSFMSPEQLEDADAADSRSDIYSLGATLYFLLTGQPPFTGEYLEQVYGHRHGEIPDLMQVRRDVDMQFANLFRRMMAKTPSARYTSLDEVIEDLGEYADKANEPQWLAEFALRQPIGDGSTFAGGSTSAQLANVLAFDLGMFYAAAAEASPLGGVNLLSAGEDQRPLLRMSLASEGHQLFFGDQAMKRRATQSKNLVHCLHMYIGKPLVEREVLGRQCPPEVLLALLLKRLSRNAWKLAGAPAAVAITVPSSYDQLHRQSILQAAQMAGLKSVRLVDRSIAAAQSLLLPDASESQASDRDTVPTSALDTSTDQQILFLGLTGQGTEAAVFHRDASRMKQLSTAGHWHTGTLAWLQRLVEMAAAAFQNNFRFDARKSTQAVRLQIACESAMNALMIMPSAKITVQINGVNQSVILQRSDWLAKCEDLIEGVRRAVKSACRDAALSRRRIDRIVTLGPLLRLTEVREAVLRGLKDDVEVQTIDRTDVARGAAACLASELPGRGSIAMPPQSVTTQTIGILIEDTQGRRRIMPIVPRGTALPARTNRRLTVGDARETMALSLVESSGIQREDWHSLGRYDFEIDDIADGEESRNRMIGFEVNVNGMLIVRAQTPGMPGSTKLAPLPKPMLNDEQVTSWTRWVDKFD